jgi:hypothetical protein
MKNENQGQVSEGFNPITGESGSMLSGSGTHIRGLGLTGGVSRCREIARRIYSDMNTPDYRDKMFAQISILEGDLSDIKKEIYFLETQLSEPSAQAYDTFWGRGSDSPINKINVRWRELFPGDNRPVEMNNVGSIQANYLVVDSAMELISKKIQDPDISALEIYYNLIDSKDSAVSEIEKCYTYYTRYLIGCLLRGFGLLGHYNGKLAELNAPVNKTNYENWNAALNTDGTILKNGGKAAQTFIDTIKDNGNSTYVYLQKSTGHAGAQQIHLGYYDLPNKGNQVLVGYEVTVNEAGNACLTVWQGDFRNDGYVENVKKVNKDFCHVERLVSDSQCLPKSGTDWDDNKGLGLVVFFDKQKVPAAKGKVAVDLSFASETTSWDEHHDRYAKYICLVPKFADVVDGKIDLKNAKWQGNSRFNDIILNTELHPLALLHGATEDYRTFSAEMPDEVIYIDDNINFVFTENKYESGVLCSPMSTIEFFGHDYLIKPWYESKIHQDQFDN